VLARTQERVAALERTVAAYRALPTLRARDAVLRIPLLGPAARRVGRLLARTLRR
jgi:C4-dicarboxylate-specific signal transduction histidine kinase